MLNAHALQIVGFFLIILIVGVLSLIFDDVDKWDGGTEE